MNYKVGDEVVCIDATSLVSGCYTELVVGKKYTVHAIRKSECCLKYEIDIGEPSSKAFTTCSCGARTKAHSFKWAWRFIKLDRLTQDTEEEATA